MYLFEFDMQVGNSQWSPDISLLLKIMEVTIGKIFTRFIFQKFFDRYALF